MTCILHLIQVLDLGGAARSALATAKYSARQGPYQHRMIALQGAEPAALRLARAAGVSVLVRPDPAALRAELENADLVQVEYWNAPNLVALLHTDLPPMRLAFWYHIAGSGAPQVIPPGLAAMPDLNIPCNPYTFEELPVFRDLPAAEKKRRVAMVYDAADFERVAGVRPVPHAHFNVGYIGTVDFVKMHPRFVPMSAAVGVPGIRFIVCGRGIEKELMRQAESLDAADRFDFRGYVEDIASVLSTLDVYGYPLCEDTYAAAELNLQEVMFAGIPPVVFPHGGVKRLVRHEETGLVVHSERDYARAIEHLYHNPDERRRLGLKAAAYAREVFGAENAARSFNLVYERLIREPKQLHRWGRPPEPVPPAPGRPPIEAPPASTLFIHALGPDGHAFEQSRSAVDPTARKAADEAIAASSHLMFKSGLFRYHVYAPHDPYLRLWMGLYLERNGQVDPAAAAYTDAYKLGLEEPRILTYLARILRRAGHLDQALALESRAAQMPPATAPALSESPPAPQAMPSPPELPPASPAPKAVPAPVHTRIATPRREAVVPSAGQADPETAYRVTAVVSTYKAESFMLGCLEDLVAQTLFERGELEIVVVDAGSPENEREIVDAFQHRYPHIVYVRSAERETIYQSWNRALCLARGRYVTNANTDDRHRADALELLADYLDLHPEIALVYPGQIDTDTPNETFETTRSQKRLDWPRYSYEELEYHCIVGSQPMWRRSLHERYGYFREDFYSAGDYEFWLRIGKHEKFFRYPETLGLYFRNPAGVEHSSSVSKLEAIRIWREYGMFERGITPILNARPLTADMADRIEAAAAEAAPPTAAPPSSAAPVSNGTLPGLLDRFSALLEDQDWNAADSLSGEAVRRFPRAPYAWVMRAISQRLLGRRADAIDALETSQHVGDRSSGHPHPAAGGDSGPHTPSLLRSTPGGASPPPGPTVSAPPEAGAAPAQTAELHARYEVLVERGNWTAAASISDTLIRDFAAFPSSWTRHARCMRALGRPVEALEAIEHSLTLQETPEALLEMVRTARVLNYDDATARTSAYLMDRYPHWILRTQDALDARPAPFMPLAPERIDALRKTDVMVASYPRSGNTWSSLLLADVLLQQAGLETQPGRLPVPIEAIVPDLHQTAARDAWLVEAGYPFRLFKSHDIDSLRRPRIVYIFRAPADALVSYYHFHRRYEHLAAHAGQGPDAFCASFAPTCHQHLATALHVASVEPERILFVAYEQLHADPTATLHRMLTFIGACAPPECLERAVENNRFDVHHDREQKQDPAREQFFRVGRPGNGEEELKAATVARLEASLAPLYEAARALAEAPASRETVS